MSRYLTSTFLVSGGQPGPAAAGLLRDVFFCTYSLPSRLMRLDGTLEVRRGHKCVRCGGTRGLLLSRHW